jgi:hypothetical protein
MFSFILKHLQLTNASLLYTSFLASNLRDSLVGMATRCGLDGRGLIAERGMRFFSTPQRPDRLWSPPSLLSNGYLRLLLRRVKRLGRKADHSPPSSVVVNNDGTVTPLPPYVFMA